MCVNKKTDFFQPVTEGNAGQSLTILSQSINIQRPIDISWYFPSKNPHGRGMRFLLFTVGKKVLISSFRAVFSMGLYSTSIYGESVLCISVD